MNAEDWEQVCSIYVEGIRTGDATFETDAPSWEKWDAGHLQKARLVARDGDKILGWAALSSVSNRCVYGGVAEVSVYVGENKASVNLHLRCGFRKVGRRERIGKLNGVWRDTLLLERRSKSVRTS